MTQGLGEMYACPIRSTTDQVVAATNTRRTQHWALCRFLSVHRYFPTDVKYPGYVRVIVHSGTKFASIWQFVEIDGKRYLQIKENRFTPATNGWYLAVPPDSKRDKHSEYIAVTPDIEKAMPVSTKPLTKDDIAALKAEQAVLNEED